jgi:hypothetical protein
VGSRRLIVLAKVGVPRKFNGHRLLHQAEEELATAFMQETVLVGLSGHPLQGIQSAYQ